MRDTTTEYITDTVIALSRLLIAKESDGSQTYYTYGAEGLIAQENTATQQYLSYHYDNIGSTTLLTNQTGAVTHRFSYGTYGELLSDAKGIRFFYNGSFWVELGKNELYFMRARYYNPDIKRFINQDIKVGDITNSQSLNRYAYCEGNPISLVDPFGLSPQGSGNWFWDMVSSFTHNDWPDLAGMLPGVGMFFDAANAISYGMQKDWLNMGLSIAGALPLIGLGISGGKILAKGLKLGDRISTVVKSGAKMLKHSGAVADAMNKMQNVISVSKNGVKAATKVIGTNTLNFLRKGVDKIANLRIVTSLKNTKFYTRTVDMAKSAGDNIVNAYKKSPLGNIFNLEKITPFRKTNQFRRGSFFHLHLYHIFALAYICNISCNHFLISYNVTDLSCH